MNNKAFTLIELLAVIVILAVIALITVPAVMSVVSDAKQSAFKDSAYGLIKTADSEYVQDTFEDNLVDKFFLFTNGVMTSYPSGSTLDYKGSTPLDGGLVLHSDGTVTMAIHDGTYCATKTRYVSEVTISAKTKSDCNSEILYSQATAPFTNLITNGDFSNGTTGWTKSAAASWSVTSAEMKYTAVAQYNQLNQTMPLVANNKYYVYCMIMASNVNIAMRFYDGVTIPISAYVTSINKYAAISKIGTTAATLGVGTKVYFEDLSSSGWTPFYIKTAVTVNLTASFGIGNEPTKDQMDHNLDKVWIDTANGNAPKRFTAGGWISF